MVYTAQVTSFLKRMHSSVPTCWEVSVSKSGAWFTRLFGCRLCEIKITESRTDTLHSGYCAPPLLLKKGRGSHQAVWEYALHLRGAWMHPERPPDNSLNNFKGAIHLDPSPKVIWCELERNGSTAKPC